MGQKIGVGGGRTRAFPSQPEPITRGGGIGPGYSDLNIGTVHDDSKLTGPFMAMIKGEIGVSCFIDSWRSVYAGLEAQHFSNSELNGRERTSTTNQSLNTPWGMVVGFSWFFR